MKYTFSSDGVVEEYLHTVGAETNFSYKLFKNLLLLSKTDLRKKEPEHSKKQLMLTPVSVVECNRGS